MSDKIKNETNILLDRINKLRTDFETNNKKGIFSSNQYKFEEYLKM
jgi:hypothetical protein